MALVVERVKSFLEEKEIKYTHFPKEEGRKEAIRVGFRGENAESVEVLLFFDDDGGSINVKSFSIAKVPAAKMMDAYVVLNELNHEYRWVKFYVDGDDEVTVSGDAIIDLETAGAECFQIILRYVDIIDEVYPRIMKVIWA